MKTAFVFPGQGSQKVGMLQDLYNAYPVSYTHLDVYKRQILYMVKAVPRAQLLLYM